MKYSTFAVVTIGCKVNQYEGEAVREGFLRGGLTETEPLDGPDILVINSCGVTVGSTADSRQWIGRARKANPDVRIVATGCCVDISPEELADADILVPQAEKHTLVGQLLEDSSEDGSDAEMQISDFGGRTRVFLKVQDGCARRCAYCAVPIARGGPKSKPRDAVLAEARLLADSGFREIVLCGIDLGSYGIDTKSGELAALLETLLQDIGDVRFRLSSIDVRDVSEELLQVMASSSNVCPHLHIPLQSGDGSVLKAMRRGYSPEEYINNIKAVQEILRLPAITTDCMVGFPGEGDAEFENTLEVCREAGFSRLHVFRFSPRPETSAWNMAGRAPDRVARERSEILIGEGKILAENYRNALVAAAMPLDVIIEKREDEGSSGLAGRYVRVNVDDSLPVGTRTCVIAARTEGTYIRSEASNE
jgi:threonylcarbamoyladenosine tRNA methylthiotransferase MtaB